MCCSDQGKSRKSKQYQPKPITLKDRSQRTITAVSVDSLEETQRDPKIDSADMQIAQEVTV